MDQQLAAASDVAHPDAWRDDRLVLNLAECPGERHLVLGNHDHDQAQHQESGRRRVNPRPGALAVK